MARSQTEFLYRTEEKFQGTQIQYTAHKGAMELKLRSISH